MERPSHVTTLAVIAIVTGVLQVIAAAVLFGIVGSGIAGLETGTGAATFTGWLFLILGVAGAAYGIGAWAMAHWSWSTGITVAALDILATIYAVVVAGFATVAALSGLVFLVLAVAELAYLYMHDVRAAFGHEPTAHPSGQMPTHA